jgi:hypothetical protein
VISYEELLEVFWHSHDPTVQAWSTQYMSIIFYHDDEQLQSATESKENLEKEFGIEVKTAFRPLMAFYQAENYHQKYYLRLEYDLMQEFREIYPENVDFINSTTAARINGMAGGFGDPAVIPELGLSETANQKLLEIAEPGLIPGCAIPGS